MQRLAPGPARQPAANVDTASWFSVILASRLGILHAWVHASPSRLEHSGAGAGYAR
jgi:hypothetical protein